MFRLNGYFKEDVKLSLRERCEFLQEFLSKVLNENQRPWAISVRLDQILKHLQEVLYFIRY